MDVGREGGRGVEGCLDVCADGGMRGWLIGCWARGTRSEPNYIVQYGCPKDDGSVYSRCLDGQNGWIWLY